MPVIEIEFFDLSYFSVEAVPLETLYGFDFAQYS